MVVQKGSDALWLERLLQPVPSQMTSLTMRYLPNGMSKDGSLIDRIDRYKTLETGIIFFGLKSSMWNDAMTGFIRYNISEACDKFHLMHRPFCLTLYFLGISTLRIYWCACYSDNVIDCEFL